MQAAQKQPFSWQIKSHPAQLASLNLETKSCLHQILVADLCVAPSKVGCSVAGRQGSRRTRSPPWIVFFWLHSMPSLQDKWKTAHACSQPKMTCQVLTWAVQFATRIPVIYTLTTFTFHTPRCNFSPVFAVSGKCCLQFSCGRWPSVSDQITGRGCACSQSAGETAQAFSLLFPYFKHLTKLSSCAQTEVPWLIIQTALSSCVSMSRVRLGSWAVPVPWLMSLCSGWAFHRKCLFSIYRHCLQCHLCGIEIHNQQTATGKNMFQLILNEQCVGFFPFFFKELIMRKIKIASSSEPVTDLRC